MSAFAANAPNFKKPPKPSITGAVGGGREDLISGGRNGKASGTGFVGRDAADGFLLRGVPEVKQTVAAERGQLLTFGHKAQANHRRGVPFKLLQQSPLRKPIDAHAASFVSGGKQVAVWRKGQRQHRGRGTDQPLHHVFFHIPQPDHQLLPAKHGLRRLGRIGQRLNEILGLGLADFLLAGQIPIPQRAVCPGRKKRKVVARHGQRPHSGGVSGKRVLHFQQRLFCLLRLGRFLLLAGFFFDDHKLALHSIRPRRWRREQAVPNSKSNQQQTDQHQRPSQHQPLGNRRHLRPLLIFLLHRRPTVSRRRCLFQPFQKIFWFWRRVCRRSLRRNWRNSKGTRRTQHGSRRSNRLHRWGSLRNAGHRRRGQAQRDSQCVVVSLFDRRVEQADFGPCQFV